MAMQKTIQIAEDEDSNPMQIPLDEKSGSLTLTHLKKLFPKAIGLKYFTENGTIRGVKLSNGKFYPPVNGWGRTVYYCATQLISDDIQSSIEFRMHDSIENVSIPDVNDDTQSNEQHSVESNESSNSFSFYRYQHDDKKIPSARRPHRCDICGNCFTQQSHMLRHRRIHTGEKPFACEHCNERFSRSDKLKLHFDRVHLGPLYLSEQSRIEAARINDKRERKPRTLDNSCVWNNKPQPATSSDSPTKTKHLTVRFKKTSNLELDNGQDGYYSVVNMAEVKMEEDDSIVEMDEDEPLIEIEDETMVKIENKDPLEGESSADGDSNMDKPSEPRTPPSGRSATNTTPDRKYNCEICNKPFSKKNQLQRHNRIHTGERPFKCQICEKSFTRIDALKRHTASMGHQKQKMEHNDVDIESVTEILIDTYPDILDSDPMSGENYNSRDADDDNDSEAHCDVASLAQVTYANSESANDARQRTEDRTRSTNKRGKQGKENYCDQCNHSFTNKFNYNLHMESHRKPERSYRCSYCDYVFGRQSHLTRHILIHTGEKPFQCKQCDERFSRSDKLKLHVDKVHNYGYPRNTKQHILVRGHDDDS